MATQPQEVPDSNALKERQVKIWTSGEYARIGNPIAIMGELLCEAVDLRSGDDVLDVATGSGNTAISAARRFCNVTGMDLAPESVEHARRRAEAEGMEIAFEVGDAEDLPYPDASFDVVLSTIGVMFCPDQEATANGLLRVCKPGGKIGLANWTPDSFTGNMLKTVGKHVPPPQVKSRLRCGEPKSGCESSSGMRSPPFRRRAGRTTSCTVGRALRRVVPRVLRPDGEGVRGARHGRAGSLAGDLKELGESRNVSGDRTLVAPSDYLEAVAVKG